MNLKDTVQMSVVKLRTIQLLTNSTVQPISQRSETITKQITYQLDCSDNLTPQ